MRLDALRIGQQVLHPQHGTGVVKTINERAAEVEFSDGRRTVDPELSGLEPAEARAALSGLNMPLAGLVRDVVESTVNALGLERPQDTLEGLGARWLGGTLVLRPADSSLQVKDLPLEVFFHKVVMLRNQLRVLEQKINAHPQLSDADKVEMQQYISRCYGSLTSFNVLFRSKEDQFNSKSG